MPFQDRIRELRRVPAGTLVPHPKNWREHPPAQKEALRVALAKIGFADALLAREMEDGRLQLIDGHLRAEIAPEQVVPVLVVDLNETEADSLLATHDPLGDMAEADAERLQALVDEIDWDSPEWEAAFAELLDSPAKGEQRDSDERSCAIPECFQIVVECGGEAQQRELFERLSGEGYECRLLTL